MSKEMEYIYAVYEERSFSKAAEKLYISQPALSTTIKKVETQLQAPIFDRSSTPIQPTPAGRFYIDRIARIMEIEREIEDYFSALSKEKRGSVSVGAATFFCAHVLPSLIEAFQQVYPGFTVSTLEANATDLVKCLQTGVVDICLDVETLNPNTYASHIWKEERIVLAVPADFAVNRELDHYRLDFATVRSGAYLDDRYPAVGMKHFGQEPFILLKKGNDIYRRGLKMCKNAGFTPRVAMYMDQMLTAYYVACDGKGIAFVRDAISRHVEPTNRLSFYKIDDKNAVRNIMLYYKKSSPLSKAGEAFVEFLFRRRTT